MQKLSRAEAGRIGGQRFKIQAEKIRQQKIEQYNLQPRLCLACSRPLAWAGRNNKFCNRACAAIYSNAQKSNARQIRWECRFCGKEHLSLSAKIGKYCDHACQANSRKQDVVERVKLGEVKDRGLIRKALIRINGRSCYECKLEEWHGHPLSVEVDHIDGNAGNNAFSNLRLLCPNCHSITKTWKGRNKGQGRAARGLPLY